MIGNKISYFRTIFPVLLLLLAASSQALAVDTQGYFSVTQFNLDGNMTPEEIEREKKRNSPLNSDLIYRVSFGRSGDVINLLNNGADPNAKNATNNSVLFTAIYRKDDEAEPITRALLHYGADPNLPEPDGSYPVLEVVGSGRADVLQTLIAYKAVLTYVRDDKNRTLKELAELRGDQSILNVLLPALEDEKSRLELLKSPENFIKIIQEYAFLNCANEYLNYYISTSPQGVDMGKFNRIINANLMETADSAKRINYLFNMETKELYKINYSARKFVVKQLKNYGSNHSRKINGVGTDRDLNNRCGKISKLWNAKNMNLDAFKNKVQK